MMIWREGTVLEERKRWGQAVEYRVEVHRTGQSDPLPPEAKALAYIPQVGTAQVGDRVLLSASALMRGLGTGGYMLIVAIPDHLPDDPPAQPGHLVKARYTPSQFMVQGVDEQESSYHSALKNADTVEGMHVIAADLHSAVPAIACAIREYAPSVRIAYVMNDGGALPAWFSQAIVGMRENGLIDATLTCGQAYGGDYEAVNVYTALLAAKHVCHADIAIVSQGPGNLGTGTRWGFSGVNVGEALNAAGILKGKPIAALRLSNADKRGRHYGISHHSLRVLKDIVTQRTIVPVPLFSAQDELSALLDDDFLVAFARGVNELRNKNALQITTISTLGLTSILEKCPVALRTMGRDLRGDPASFLGAAVAGIYAAHHV